MDISTQRYGEIEQFFYKIPVDFWKIHVGEVVAPWRPLGFRLKLIVMITFLKA